MLSLLSLRRLWLPSWSWDWSMLGSSSCHQSWDPEDFHGFPLGLGPNAKKTTQIYKDCMSTNVIGCLRVQFFQPDWIIHLQFYAYSCSNTRAPAQSSAGSSAFCHRKFGGCLGCFVSPCRSSSTSRGSQMYLSRSWEPNSLCQQG